MGHSLFVPFSDPATYWIRKMDIRKLVQSAAFNHFVVGVILVNAVLIGMSTYLTDATALRAIAVAETICVGIYVVEIVLRFIARDSAAAFFGDGWNLFDLVIIVAAFVPAANGIGTTLRILRVLRVLRLVKTIPELRMIVTVLLRSVREHEVRRVAGGDPLLRLRGDRGQTVRGRRPPDASLLLEHPRGVFLALPDPHR
jgi:hypothetical protein